MKKILIVILITLTISAIVSQKLTVQLTLADDHDDNGYSDGPSCDGHGGGSTCANPQTTNECDLTHLGYIRAYQSTRYVNIPVNPPCEAGFHGCLTDCQIQQQIRCEPDAVIASASPAASTPPGTTGATTPGSPTVTTNGSCSSVSVQWSSFENTTGCVSTTSYSIYRREVDGSDNPVSGSAGQYILIVSLVRGNVYVDSTVVIGKKYQYKVQAVAGTPTAINITTPMCQPNTGPQESSINIIPACPSAEPPASQQPAASITPPAPRSKYVCHTVNTPNSNGGNQLQLQTLKCEYVN